MKTPFHYIFLAIGSLASVAYAIVPGDRVDNFRLLDQAGNSHELHYLSDAKAIVIMVHGIGCPIVRQSLPELAAVRKQFAAQGVEFLLINSNPQDDRAALAQEAAEFGIDLPILRDETQLVGESLGITRTAEIFVIDPKTWKLAYRGPIDDRLSLGAQKPKAQHYYLADALTAVLADKPVAVKEAEAVGCIVNLAERDRKAEHAKISYVEQIAPLLQEKCVACHRPGGIGPWAMTSYVNVRGFAPMIREVTRAGTRPSKEKTNPPSVSTSDSSPSGDSLMFRCSSSSEIGVRAEATRPCLGIVRNIGFFRLIVLILDLANNLLDKIFNGNEAVRAAVFVNHERHVNARRLHADQ